MPVSGVVDSHVHFWDRPHAGLRWDWLEPESVHPHLPDISFIKALPKYTSVDFAVETKASSVSKAVHVQAAIGSEDPVEETRWLQAMADETGWPHGIVGEVRLQDHDVEGVIERHCEVPNFRGVREAPSHDLRKTAFRRGFALLEKHDLVFDLFCSFDKFDDAANLAADFPEVTIVLEHAGFPTGRTDAYLAQWTQRMRMLGRLENVVCKVSGLGMGDQIEGRRWTIESIRPYVLECLAAFGTDRCLFGSNWPVDRMYSDYGQLITAYRSILADLSELELAAFFSTNAERVYRI